MRGHGSREPTVARRDSAATFDASRCNLHGYTRAVPPLPHALVELLPDSLPPARVRSALRLSGSPSSQSGETWLLELDEGLAVLTRDSRLDRAMTVPLAPRDALVLDDAGQDPRLRIRDASGETFDARPSRLELDALRAMLDRAGGRVASSIEDDAPQAARTVREPTGPVPEPTESTPSAVTPSISAPAPSAAELDATYIRAIAAVGESIDLGQLPQALEQARTLANAAPEPERGPWDGAVAVLERIAQGKPVSAFMLTRGAVDLPVELDDSLYLRLAGDLERAHEPLLAAAALDELTDGELARRELGRVLRELDPALAEDRLARHETVGKRVLEHFRDGVERGELGALRASAHALAELHRPAEALDLLRRAIAANPQHLPSRLFEAQLLLEQAEQGRNRDALSRERREVLGRIVDEFPASATALLELANDYVVANDKHSAVQCYRRALARDFDEQVVLDLADLLDRLGQTRERIELLEQAHATTEFDYRREEFARLLARAHRTSGTIEAAKRWTAEVERSIRSRERPFAIAAILLMIVLLVAVLVFLVLSRFLMAQASL